MPNGWRTINSLVHKIRLHGRRGKGMAESFSRQKSRHAPQKEGGLKILCDLPPVWPRLVRPTNLMSRMDGKKTHTHTTLHCIWLVLVVVCTTMFLFVKVFWCPCMAINVRSVQYNGGLLPDIVIPSLTQCYYYWGTRLNAMKMLCLCSLWSHLLSVLTFPPPCVGCSEGLDAFRFFFKLKKFPRIVV